MDPTSQRLIMGASAQGGGLYAFTDATFTPGGHSGRTGPSLTQARNGVSSTGSTAWVTDTSFFNVVDGIMRWTVPKDGTYRIQADGAGGGSSSRGTGGLGASMRGDFTLTQGEIIRILVGQKGEDFGGNNNGDSSGGGGGTFVVRTPYNTNGSILVIAGGGSGKSYCNDAPVGNGTTGTTTEASYQSSGLFNAGTSSGNGGVADPTQGSSGNPPGYAAAGFFGDGGFPSYEPESRRARAFTSSTNPGYGADQCTTRVSGGRGGFGGGGSGNGQPGPGGGYSGAPLAAGWCWGNTSPHVAGGSSFNSGSNQSNTAGARTGDGRVIITAL